MTSTRFFGERMPIILRFPSRFGASLWEELPATSLFPNRATPVVTDNL